MSFKKYVHNTVISRDLVETVSDENLELLSEEVILLESELNELFGIGTAAEKLKKLNDAGDKAVESAKEKGKEVLATAKYAAGNMAKEAKDKIVGDAKAVGQAHVEIAQAAAKVIANLFSKSQDVVKDLFGKVTAKNMTAEQLETLKQLEEILAKMKGGKFLSPAESLKVLAAALAGGSAKEVPAVKEYMKELDRLKKIPGLKSIHLAVKSAKE